MKAGAPHGLAAGAGRLLFHGLGVAMNVDHSYRVARVPWEPDDDTAPQSALESLPARAVKPLLLMASYVKS